jgi:hypothetical protein
MLTVYQIRETAYGAGCGILFHKQWYYGREIPIGNRRHFYVLIVIIDIFMRPIRKNGVDHKLTVTDTATLADTLYVI